MWCLCSVGKFVLSPVFDCPLVLCLCKLFEVDCVQSNCFDSAQHIGFFVVLAGYVTDVCGVLADEAKSVLLCRVCPFWSLKESCDQWFVVGEDTKNATIKKVLEVLY